jgi:hypothetical protein
MEVTEKCERLHKLFNGMKPRRFEKSEIDGIGFENGVYVIFEEGEKAHGGNRVVRIGTTTGDKTTPAGRLTEHYENEGRSVFRNNVALCLLEKNGDPLNLKELFLKDSIYRRQWKKNATPEQLQKYLEINEAVSGHIRKNCSFVVFSVEKTLRVFFEAKLISTVSTCVACAPSADWLGNYAQGTKDIIHKKGLWNIKDVNGNNIITDEELSQLEQLVEASRKK